MWDLRLVNMVEYKSFMDRMAFVGIPPGQWSRRSSGKISTDDQGRLGSEFWFGFRCCLGSGDWPRLYSLPVSVKSVRVLISYISGAPYIRVPRNYSHLPSVTRHYSCILKHGPMAVVLWTTAFMFRRYSGVNRIYPWNPRPDCAMKIWNHECILHLHVTA